MLPPALLISAPQSGAGKTTVTLGLLRALRRRGLRVGAAKAGPDYIDPAFHAAAAGVPSINLDSWAMPPAILASLLQRAGERADLLVIEGAMGLFDGAIGTSPGRSAAAADLARRFRLPVLLVMDVARQMQSAAAILQGFTGFDPAVEIAGVILNRVASPRHRVGLDAALAGQAVPVLGALPREAGLALPERHLGLVQAGEHDDLDRKLDDLAVLVERHVDLNALLRIAAVPRLGGASGGELPPPGQRIALARDAAFSFVYPHLLESWRRSGAEIVTFSPLADEAPPEDCDMCWLPGGYPELHAGRLAGAGRFLSGLRTFARTRPVHGECGGYMVLGRGLVDLDGQHHAMAGLLDHISSMHPKRLTLGYREARLLASSPIFQGTALRGHEFHYAHLSDPGTDTALFEVNDPAGQPLGPAGTRRGHASGTFFHVIAAA